MNCPKCHYTWEISSAAVQAVKFCPACAAPLEVKQPKDFDTLGGALQYMRACYGAEVFLNKARFFNLFRDLALNLARDVKVFSPLTTAFDVEIPRLFLQADGKSDSEKTIALKLALRKLHEDAGIVEERARVVTGAFAEAFGWEDVLAATRMPEPVPPVLADPPAPVTKPKKPVKRPKPPPNSKPPKPVPQVSPPVPMQPTTPPKPVPLISGEAIRQQLYADTARDEYKPMPERWKAISMLTDQTVRQNILAKIARDDYKTMTERWKAIDMLTDQTTRQKALAEIARDDYKTMSIRWKAIDMLTDQTVKQSILAKIARDDYKPKPVREQAIERLSNMDR